MSGRRLAALILTGTVCFAAVPVPDSLGAARPRTSLEELPDSTSTVAAIPTDEEFSRLAQRDPIRMLESSTRRMKSELHTYRMTMIKKERVHGDLHAEEEVLVSVRESPYAVRMKWKRGARSVFMFSVEGVLYVAGENEGKLIVRRPAAIVSTLSVSPTDSSARDSSRFCITEAGLIHAAERTRRAWTAARDRGTLQVEYLGLKAVDELGGRKCHVLRRTCEPPEVDSFLMNERAQMATERPKDAFRTVTVMIDAETWIQTGAELRRADGELIASYYFRDLEINVSFPADHFKKDSFRVGK